MNICQVDSCRLAGLNEVLAVLLLAKKLNVPVCPHAGGVGLCEMVQHIAMIDYICLGGPLEGRLAEYSDHLHDHFVHPVQIVNGHYQVPTVPGYSVTMRPESLDDYVYPKGRVWRERM